MRFGFEHIAVKVSFSQIVQTLQGYAMFKIVSLWGNLPKKSLVVDVMKLQTDRREKKRSVDTLASR